jgi:hypothetical protein
MEKTSKEATADTRIVASHKMLAKPLDFSFLKINSIVSKYLFSNINLLIQLLKKKQPVEVRESLFQIVKRRISKIRR